MKTFKQLIAERSMDLTTAMKWLEIDAIPDENTLKGAYKKASLKYHPDKGGSTAAMQDVNLAYDTLKKMSKTPVNGQGVPDLSDWYYDVAESIKKEYMAKMNVSAYEKHFEKHFGQPFKGTMKGFPAKATKRSKYSHPYYAGVRCEFKSKDGETIFDVDISMYLTTLRKTTSLGGKDTGATVTVSLTGFRNNRKMKVNKRDYTWTNSTKIFSDPKVLYPDAKMKTMIKSNAKRTKSKKFARRDADMFIQNKIKGAIRIKDGYMIPINDHYIAQVNRGTFMRTPYWSVNFICDYTPENKYSRWGKGVHVSSRGIPETEEFFILFAAHIKKARTLKSKDAIIKYFEKVTKEMSEKAIKDGH